MAARLVVALLYLLLLGMQQEGLRHGIADHLRGELAQAHERAIVGAAEPCDECALLAGAAHAVASAPAAFPPLRVAFSAPPARAHAHTPVAVRYYAARAPPLLG